MKRTFAFLLVLAIVAGIAACGDKSTGGGVGGGPVGAWSIDVEKLIDLGMAEAKKQLEQLPEDQRKMAEEAMGGKAAREMMTKKLGGMKMDVDVKADKTFSVTAGEPGSDKSEAITGTWEEKGGKFVFQTKTKNGQPATGADAKSIDAKMVGGNLVLTMPEGPELALKRR